MAEKKIVQFVRRIKQPGIYTGNIDSEETVVKIVDRAIYGTDNPGVIKFLQECPEVEEYGVDKPSADPVNFKKLNKDELVELVIKREIMSADDGLGELNKAELIELLEEDEKENQ